MAVFKPSHGSAQKRLKQQPTHDHRSLKSAQTVFPHTRHLKFEVGSPGSAHTISDQHTSDWLTFVFWYTQGTPAVLSPQCPFAPRPGKVNKADDPGGCKPHGRAPRSLDSRECPHILASNSVAESVRHQSSLQHWPVVGLGTADSETGKAR
jgi:hypothetical protein